MKQTGGAARRLMVWAAMWPVLAAAAQLSVFEHEDFRGRFMTTHKRVGSLDAIGFNDRGSSAVVDQRRWEVCEQTRYLGRCRVLEPGRYPSLIAMGLQQPIASARLVGPDEPVAAHQLAPTRVAVRDHRRRPGEPLHLAWVVAVRVVVGEPGQHCWIESKPDIRAGQPLDGILDYQSDGQPVDASQPQGRDPYTQVLPARSLAPCQALPRLPLVAYWDLSYTFRGIQYTAQAMASPGLSILVNRHGEPRE